MKKAMLTLMLLSAGFLLIDAAVEPGDDAINFSLTNVDGTTVSLSDYADQKGVILVFTCNPCPFAKAYEQRIIKLHEDYASRGFPVVAVNPNDDELSPEDTFENMQARATERGYPFPYLKDETQEVYKSYGAARTPHIFLLTNQNGNFKVAYIGAIDDNAMEETEVTTRYVEEAIKALISGITPETVSTKAIGCTIKTKA